jgi:hypothetical protein
MREGKTGRAGPPGRNPDGGRRIFPAPEKLYLDNTNPI